MRTRLLLAATAALVTPLAAPAHAAVSQPFTAHGTGVIAPGLPCVACQVHADLTVVYAPLGLAAVSCTFDGTSDGLETLAQGTGSGTVYCSDGSGGPVVYDRTLAATRVDGRIYRPACTVLSAVLTFTPTNASPTTTFAVAGGGTLTTPC
jgi:hypothetical protein